MILVKNLFHSYTNNEMYAVEDVNFIIQKGENFWFFRPVRCRKINHAKHFDRPT